MKALLPVCCRIAGYVILLVAVFSPFALMIHGLISDENLLICKEAVKLLIIIGLLMILLARTRHESDETATIRTKAMRYAFLLTVAYIFVQALFRLYKGDGELTDASSFLVFMAINVACLEFGIKKASVDKIFRNKGKD